MMNCIHVHVQARAVYDHGNGVFTLAIPTTVLSTEQENLLMTMFPHTRNEIEKALNTEALLGAHVTPQEVDQKATPEDLAGLQAEKRHLREIYGPMKDQPVR